MATEIDNLKDIGLQILRLCDGLPLAIKVMGGLLSTKFPNEREWKAVLESPAWSVAGLPQALDSRLYMSYADMSPQLKQCFLYCSVFISKSKLIYQAKITDMWVSEGFIQPLHGSIISQDDRLEEIATEHYQELITRNLIEPTKRHSLTRYECTMHDVVRSFAEFMAGEELLVLHQNRQTAGDSSGLVRRLCIGPTMPVAEWTMLQKHHKSLRTLVAFSRINFRPGDALGSFSGLRVLHIVDADIDGLIGSLCQLRHLRYLYLDRTDISRLPNNIDKMKFLQYIILLDCKKLDHLPSNIRKLAHLRCLDISGSNVNVVPRGLGGLTNLRMLYGFPVYVDKSGNWCSLSELEHLSHLRDLELVGLANVSDSTMAERAMISSKDHLGYLALGYSSASGQMVETGGDDEVHQQQPTQTLVEEVLEKLRPPTSLENLGIEGGYSGQRLPTWMQAPASTTFKSLRYLRLEDLPYCSQLPDGLCCLPSLELLIIRETPAIKRIGPEFQGCSLVAGDSSATSAPFPKLRELQFDRLCEWEEWEWNAACDHEDVKAHIAMPTLERLDIRNCKLSCLPPGLADSRRHALRELWLYRITNLTSVENFPSVVHLDVFDCPDLKRISGLSRLQKIRIVRCSNLDVLEGVPVLDSLELKDTTMETLPGYLQAVKPRYLDLTCSRDLYDSLKSGTSSELEKINHIRSRNIDYWPKED
ncbi:hypothetical protein ACP4OV_002182 [Aristida adscensionis]